MDESVEKGDMEEADQLQHAARLDDGGEPRWTLTPQSLRVAAKLLQRNVPEREALHADGPQEVELSELTADRRWRRTLWGLLEPLEP